MSRTQPPSPTPEDASRLSDLVYQSLRDEILAGHLSPGERLVRRKIGARLGVSPAPVTEALARLNQDGLVIERSDGGMRVYELTADAVAGDITLREALETQAIYLATQRADASTIAALDKRAAHLDRLINERDQSTFGMRLHMAFHLQIAHAAGTPKLTDELHRVWSRHLLHLNWINRSREAPPPGWHDRLVRAIEAGDADQAVRAMRLHVRFGSDQVMRNFENIAP